VAIYSIIYFGITN